MEFEPGEEVFFHGHPSWRSILDFYFKGLVLAIIAGAVAGVVTAIVAGHVQAGWIVAAVLVVFVIVLVSGVIKRRRITYSITDQRLTIQSGLLASDLHETRLERVQNVNCRQSPLERLFRVGTVDFDTAAGGNFDFSFTGVADPKAIVRTVNRALRERLEGPGHDALGVPGSATPPQR
jgi:uncharacterized membrane protein YdbT with pleckstrin-like domain